MIMYIYITPRWISSVKIMKLIYLLPVLISTNFSKLGDQYYMNIITNVWHFLPLNPSLTSKACRHHRRRDLVSCMYPDSKAHGANMGPTWVLSAPDGPHVGPMNLAIRVCNSRFIHINTQTNSTGMNPEASLQDICLSFIPWLLWHSNVVAKSLSFYRFIKFTGLATKADNRCLYDYSSVAAKYTQLGRHLMQSFTE